MSNEAKQSSAARHTPGPWKLGAETDFYDDMLLLPIEQGRGEIALVHMEADQKTGEANARLIAAAPDMLEALKLALDDSSFEDGHAKLTMDTLDQIRSAIAKAEGRE